MHAYDKKIPNNHESNILFSLGLDFEPHQMLV
jgi:hypothetical protein